MIRMHSTVLIYLIFLIIVTVARPGNDNQRVKREIQTSDDTRSPSRISNLSRACDGIKSDNKLRAKRTLVLLMPMEEEENESIEDTEETAPKSQKTKRCKTPTRRLKASVPMNKYKLNEPNGDILGSKRVDGFYDERTSKENIDKEPTVRLIYLKDPKTVLKNILTSDNFEEDDLPDGDENIGLLKAIREHLKSKDYKDDVLTGRTREKSRSNDNNKYVCYCHEESRHTPNKKSLTRDFISKPPWPLRKEKTQRHDAKKLLDIDDTPRKRPIYVNIPEHRLVPQRLPILYSDIPRMRHIPKPLTRKVAPILHETSKNIENNLPHTPFLYNVQPELALYPVHALQDAQPFALNGDRNYLLGHRAPVTQGYRNHFFPRHDPLNKKSHPFTDKKNLHVTISSQDQKKENNDIVGKSRYDLTTERANNLYTFSGDIENLPTGTSEVTNTDMTKGRTSVYLSSLSGETSVSIEECIKLYGRDVCVISATSTRTPEEINAEKDKNDYNDSKELNKENDNDSHEIEKGSASHETTNSYYTLENTPDSLNLQDVHSIIPIHDTTSNYVTSVDETTEVLNENSLESSEIVGSSAEFPITESVDENLEVSIASTESNEDSSNSSETNEEPTINNNFVAQTVTTYTTSKAGDEIFGKSAEIEYEDGNDFEIETPGNFDEIATYSSSPTTASMETMIGDVSTEIYVPEDEIILGKARFNEKTDEDAPSVGKPHTGLGEEYPISGPTMSGEGTLDYSDIKVVTSTHFTSKAYENETGVHSSNWPSSYDNLHVTGNGIINSDTSEYGNNDVKVQSKLDLDDTVNTSALNDHSEVTSVNEINTSTTVYSENSNEESLIEKVHTIYTTTEDTIDDLVGRSRTYTSEEFENSDFVQNEETSSAEDATVLVSSTSKNEDEVSQEIENITEAPTLQEEVPEEFSSSETQQLEKSVSSLEEEYKDTSETHINTDDIDQDAAREEQLPSFTDYDNTSLNNKVTENTEDDNTDSSLEKTIYPEDPEVRDYMDSSLGETVNPEVSEVPESSPDYGNSNEGNVGAAHLASVSYEDETPSDELNDVTENKAATHPLKETLPFCDNTLLHNAIKAVINNFTTTDSLDLENDVNEEVVGMAGESLLPEVLGIPNLKGILSIPLVEGTIVDRVKNLLSKIIRIPSHALKDIDTSNVIKNNLRHMMAAIPDSNTELPPMTVEEHIFKNGAWTTHLVTLAPTESGEERIPANVKKLQNTMNSILGNPAMSFEAAKKPIVQNIVLQSVKSTFEPENVTSGETLDDWQIDDFLGNIWSRYTERLNNKNDTSEEDDESLKIGQAFQGKNDDAALENNSEMYDTNIHAEDFKKLLEGGLPSLEFTASNELDKFVTAKDSSNENASAPLVILNEKVTATVQSTREDDETTETNVCDASSISQTTQKPSEYVTVPFTDIDDYAADSEGEQEFEKSNNNNDDVTTETLKEYITDADRDLTTNSEYSSIINMENLQSENSDTINPVEKLYNDEDIEIISAVPLNGEEIESSEKQNAALVITSVTEPFISSYEHTQNADDAKSAETDDVEIQEVKGPYEKSSTKYYHPNDRVLEYVKNHRTNSAEADAEKAVSLPESVVEEKSQSLEENVSESKENTNDSSNINSNTSGENYSKISRAYSSNEENNSRPWNEETEDLNRDISDNSNADLSSDIVGLTRSSETTNSYVTGASTIVENSSTFTPTSNVYEQTPEVTESKEMHELKESSEEENFKSAAQNIYESFESPDEKSKYVEVFNPQNAFSSPKNQELPTEWKQDYLATTQGFVKTHEVTTEIQKKVTKTTKYFQKIPSDLSTKYPSTSQRSQEYNEDVTEVFAGNYDDINESNSENSAEFVGDRKQDNLNKDSFTDDITVRKNPAYFGKISLESKKNNSKDLLDLLGSDLHYIGDGVKLPLEIRKLNDGSYALSISRKVCEHILNRKCPCCVPLEGKIVRSTKRHVHENKREVKTCETIDKEGTKKRCSRTDRKLVTEISDQIIKPYTTSKRSTRDIDVSDDLQDISMPVKIFAKKYNLSLDLENVEMPCQVESTDLEATKKKSVGDKKNNTNSDLVHNLLSIHDVPDDAKLTGILNPYKSIKKSKMTNSGQKDQVNDRRPNTDEEVMKYGYQTNNPILNRVKLITEKQKDSTQYRYQRNIGGEPNKRAEVVKTVLSWLKGLILDDNGMTSTNR